MNTTRFVFRGSRDYLHSTTVFDYILSEVRGQPSRIDFKFNRRTDRVCALTRHKPSEDKPPVAIYTDSRQTLYIVESGLAITERVPYDEDGLAKNFCIDGHVIHVPAASSGNSFIECVVAAYKRLLLDLHGKHRFAFVRISLERLPQGAFAVEFARKLSGDFYEGSIEQDGNRVGRIFFGEWQ